MHIDWKKVLRNLGLLLAVALLGGLFLVPFLVFGALGAYPLYVTYGGLVLGVCGLLALFLWNCDYFPDRWCRRLGWGTLCILAAAAVYIGHGVWRDSLATVDDRSLVLQDYIPFEENNLLATLDEPATLQFDTPWAVKLDGATALYPVYAAFAQAVYPDGSENHSAFRSSVACGGTIEAYDRLLKGDVDIIFAGGPSNAQKQAFQEAGMELYLTPIGREAFVFFVNSKNPVTSLTVEQVQGIYTGDITRWNQVGGKNQRIRPFQRAENSGSQTALQSLMAGLPLMKPEEEDRISGMGGIIRQVASYRNYQNAIGFSFRYYAAEMVRNGDIRLLSLNGVEPTTETIQDGSYPISSEFYAVTASRIGRPAPRESHPAVGALLNWILSPQGQSLIEKTGYVALS